MQSINKFEFVRINQDDFVVFDDNSESYKKMNKEEIEILLNELKLHMEEDVSAIININKKIIELLTEQYNLSKKMYKKADAFFDERYMDSVDLSYFYETVIDSKEDLKTFEQVWIDSDNNVILYI